METISVIIPTLNEARTLPVCLDCLNRQSRLPQEILVVDGGSEDTTRLLARQGGARFIFTEQKGRAQQMNAGAAFSRGSLLLFLHADTLLHPRALKNLVRAMENRNRVGGGFKRRFHPPHPGLALTSRLADFRGKFWGYFHGDQAIFCRRSSFEEAGGFPERYPFEDFDLCRKLKRIGKLTTLSPPVISSSRRFGDRGAFKTVMGDLRLTWNYLLESSKE